MRAFSPGTGYGRLMRVRMGVRMGMAMSARRPDGRQRAIERVRVAARAFGLDRRVADPKLVLQHMIQVSQDRGRLADLLVGDDDVAAQRIDALPDLPDM